MNFAMKLPMGPRRLVLCQAESDVPVMQPAAPEIEAPPRSGSQLGPAYFSMVHGTWKNDLQKFRGFEGKDETR